MDHVVGKILHLGAAWQFAFEQQITGLEVIAVLRNLLDRVTAIQQLALVTIDVGDLRVTRGRREEPRVEGEFPRLAVQFADINDVRADRAFVDRQAYRQRRTSWLSWSSSSGSPCVVRSVGAAVQRRKG
jgi:hypothetical protein